MYLFGGNNQNTNHLLTTTNIHPLAHTVTSFTYVGFQCFCDSLWSFWVEANIGMSFVLFVYNNIAVKGSIIKRSTSMISFTGLTSITFLCCSKDRPWISIRISLLVLILHVLLTITVLIFPFRKMLNVYLQTYSSHEYCTLLEKLENTIGVITSCKLKDRQYNVQKTDKQWSMKHSTENCSKNMKNSTKNGSERRYGGYKVPAPLVAPVTFLLLQTRW